MFTIETCKSDLVKCNDAFIKILEWKKSIEDWVKEYHIFEYLKNNEKKKDIIFHNNLNIFIAGCSNVCFKPKISDIYILGYVKPDFNLENCNKCDSCVYNCPDLAISREKRDYPVLHPKLCNGCLNCYKVCPGRCISLSEIGVKIIVGERFVNYKNIPKSIEVKTPEQLISFLNKIIKIKNMEF